MNLHPMYDEEPPKEFWDIIRKFGDSPVTGLAHAITRCKACGRLFCVCQGVKCPHDLSKCDCLGEG